MDGVGLMVMVDVAEDEERRARRGVALERVRGNMFAGHPASCGIVLYQQSTAKSTLIQRIWREPRAVRQRCDCQTRTGRVIDTVFLPSLRYSNDAARKRRRVQPISCIDGQLKPILHPTSYTVTQCHTCHRCDIPIHVLSPLRRETSVDSTIGIDRHACAA